MSTQCRFSAIFHSLFLVATCVALATSVVRADEQYVLSFGFIGNIQGDEILPNNVYEYDPVNDEANLFLDGDAAGLDNTIHGVDLLSDDSLLLSFGFIGNVGGQHVEPTNIYAYDTLSGDVTLFLDGNAIGLDSPIRGLDLLSSGNLLLSFGLTGHLGGQEIVPTNIYEYDPVNGVATVFLDGEALGTNSPISGLDLLPSGNLLLTFGFIGDIGGQAILPNNVYEYDPVNNVASLFLDGNSAGLYNVANGVASLALVPEPSSILLCLIAASTIAILARAGRLRV